MRWLITGGCGFIGTNLIHYLSRQGNHIIRVIDNLSVGRREDLAAVTKFSEIGEFDQRWADTRAGRGNNVVELIVGDIRNESLAKEATGGADVIVHLAANTGVAPSMDDPVSDCKNNVLGTLNYLDAARQNQVERFVFASSGAPVGEVQPPIHEEIVPHPISPYGASKLAGEAYCSAYNKSFHLETVALRFGNVYGPRSHHKSSVVAKFIRDALTAGVLEVHGDGGQTRDFIYVVDLVKAIEKAATVPGIGGELFQIAANTETTVSELANQILSILEGNGVMNVATRHARIRPGDVRRNYSDITKARDRLGWLPTHSLQDGLDSTIDYFMELHNRGLLAK